MGHDATTTLSEIEAARQRLQRDVDVLEARLRDGDVRGRLIRLGAVTTAAGLGLFVLTAVTRRRLRWRAERRRDRRQAAALAEALEARGRRPATR